MSRGPTSARTSDRVPSPAPRPRDPSGRARSTRARFIPAGYALGVGLVCFGAWFLFDARQLYQSAVTSPLGVRRSVSMALTRPVARVEEFLSLDRLVNGADRAIGKTGTPGGSAFAITPPPPPTTSNPPRTRPSTTLPRPTTTGAPGSTTVPGSTLPATTLPPAPGLPALVEPSAQRPLQVLNIGDSIGEDLGIGLADVLGGSPSVNVAQRAVGDTGLANLGYYSWPAELSGLLTALHPAIVVAMFGANDQQSFQAGNSVVQFGTPEWRRIYRARVAELMSEATAAGARVLWVGLPIMGPTSRLSNTGVARENAVYAYEARHHAGVRYMSTWKLFEDASGQYATYLSVAGAGLVQVRDPDEVHIDPPGGTDLLARAAVVTMERAWHVRL